MEGLESHRSLGDEPKGSQSMEFPHRVVVEHLVSSRYRCGRRPQSWDLRVEGIDVIRNSAGEELRLLSNGQQSPPKPGWTLILTSGDSSGGFRWTLYGISRPN